MRIRVHPEIIKLLKTLNGDELLEIRSTLDRLIKNKFQNDSGRRKDKHVDLNLTATFEVEREKQFFDLEHKITIFDMSVNGLRFISQKPLLEYNLPGRGGISVPRPMV